MRIEKLAKEHLDKIIEIENLCFKTPWSRESMADEFNNDVAHYFVLIDGEVIGYCGFWAVVDEAQVMNIAVHPSMQGKGCGSLILNKMVNHAIDLGLALMTLEVREDNIAAIKLYESKGFVSVGKRNDYYGKGENAILYTKVLE